MQRHRIAWKILIRDSRCLHSLLGDSFPILQNKRKACIGILNSASHYTDPYALNKQERKEEGILAKTNSKKAKTDHPAIYKSSISFPRLLSNHISTQMSKHCPTPDLPPSNHDIQCSCPFALLTKCDTAHPPPSPNFLNHPPGPPPPKPPPPLLSSRPPTVSLSLL